MNKTKPHKVATEAQKIAKTVKILPYPEVEKLLDKKAYNFDDVRKV